MGETNCNTIPSRWMKDGVELKTKRKKQNFFLPCKSITTSILIRDFFGFNAGMASKGGTSEGCLGLPSISRRWKQHESWSTRERPTQLNVVKLGISPALQVCVCDWVRCCSASSAQVISTHFSTLRWELPKGMQPLDKWERVCDCEIYRNVHHKLIFPT